MIQLPSTRIGQSKAWLVFFYAAMISFLGSLPLGSFNLLTVRLAYMEGRSQGFLFAIGGLFAELLYIGVSLALINRFLKSDIFKKLVNAISLILIVSLAIAAFVAAGKENSDIWNVLGLQDLSPLSSGFLLMAANPVQIPFWFGWAVILLERNLLQQYYRHYVMFASGAASGSLMASTAFVFVGQQFSLWYPISERNFHLVMGTLLIVIAGFQMARLFLHPGKGPGVADSDPIHS